MTTAPTCSVEISLSGRSCREDSTRLAIASRSATLTGRFSQAFSMPAMTFSRSKRDRDPSFLTTMYGTSSIRS